MNEFQITVQRKAEGGWPVVVRHQPGERELTLWSRGWLDLDLKALVPLLPSDKAYGLVLGKALFRKDIQDAFVRADAKAKDADEPLRVLLSVEADDLRCLHWEQVCAPLDRGWDYLLLNQGTPFSLYLPSQIQLRFPPIGRRDLRALLLVAGPEELEKNYSLAPFDVAATVGSVQQALGEIPSGVLASREGAIGPPTLNALSEHLTAGDYTLLHIVCHGKVKADSGETVLYFRQDESGRPVKATILIKHLGRLARLPHFTFLSTCESADPQAEAGLGGLGQRLVRELGMPAIVAMTDRISIATAGALASAFYGRLREHGEIDRALCEALVGLQGRYDVTVPALFSRLGGRPLWSDTIDRPLTEAEIRYGLEQLPGLLAQRAPIMSPQLRDHSARILASLGAEAAALSTETRRERDAASAAVNQLCLQALDLSFNALALGHKPPDYDARCPFPGLSAFGARFLATGEDEQDDRQFFFGRDELVRELKNKLAKHNFLPIVGPSGSGKSSLVVAGLIPALQEEEPHLQMAYLTPGGHPLAQLEANRSEVQGKAAVLVVDQFEELFTLCADEGERQTFLDHLLALVGEMRVVITMRADFWGDCAPYPALRAEMQAWQELIAPMDAPELRVAMEQQAEKVGLRFEADLSNTILDDVSGEPGAMPLLQHALLELWNRRHGRWLLAEEYREGIGGVQQAIAHTADALYEALSLDDQVRMRDVFLRLTRLGDEVLQDEERRDTRQRVRFKELVPAGSDPAPIRKLVQELARVGLIVTGLWQTPEEGKVLDDGQIKVEVAHEALIRHWPRLRSWLDEDRAGLRLREGVREAALEWEAYQHDEAYLVHRGGRLEDAEALSQQPRFALNKLEQAYLEACVELRERQRREEKERLRREAEAARKLAAEQGARADEQAENAARMRRRAVVIGAVGVVAILLAVLSALFWNRAQNSAATATANLAVAVINEAEANSQKAIALTNEARANVESTRAVANASTAEAHAKAEATARHEADVQSQEAQRQASVSLSRELAATALNNLSQAPELSLLLALEAVDTDPTFEAEDALRQVLHRSYHSIPLGEGIDSVSQAAFSPDGKLVLTANDAGTIQVSDSLTGRQISSFDANTDTTPTITFSPDSQSILVVDNEAGAASLWEVSGTLIAPLNGHSAAINTASFSPSGEWIVTASQDNTARVWETATGTLIAPLIGHGAVINTASFSASGEWIVTASQDNTARVWETATGQEKWLLQGTAEGIRAAAVSPDDQWIVVQEVPMVLSVWEAQTGERRGTYRDVIEWTFHGAGVLALLEEEHGGARIVEAQTGNQVALLQDRAPNPISWAFFDPGATLVATTWPSCGNPAEIWDTSTGRKLSVLPVPTVGFGSSCGGGVRDVILGPTGQRVVTLGGLREALLWNPNTGQQVANLGSAEKAAFSPDSARLVTIGREGVRLYDATSGELLRAFPDLREVVFSPLGERLLGLGGETGSGTASLWLSGAEVATLVGHSEGVGSAFFDPSGELIATAGSGTVRLWDASTGSELPRLQCGGGDLVDAVFDHGGKRIAIWESIYSRGGWVRVCDVATGARLFEVDAYYPLGAEFSPDGRWLVWTTASSVSVADLDTGEVIDGLFPDEAVREEEYPCDFWDFGPDGASALLRCGGGMRVLNADWQERFRFQAESATFSPDGKQILARTEDGTVGIWDAMTGEQIVTWDEDPVFHEVRFSPDGKRLVTIDDGHTARILETATGQELLVLRGHTGTVVSAEYSPDGQRIVTASEDQTARVWDAETGQALSVLRGHKRGLNSATFSPNGELILTASDDGTARVYLVHLQDLVALAKSRVTRQLTCQERQVYLHEEIVCPTPTPTATAVPATPAP